MLCSTEYRDLRCYARGVSHEGDRAQSTLRELEAVTGQTRRASRSMATGFPLIGWGAAWIVGLGALELLDGALQIVVPVLAWVVGMLTSWLPVRTVIRTGVETRMRWAWIVVLLASPFLVNAASPPSFSYGVLLLGGLWGLAMCLYAVATEDRLLIAVSGFGIVMAGVLAGRSLAEPLLWFGISAGVPLLALGVYRVVRGVGRV